MQHVLNAIERRLVDDGRNRDLDPLRARVLLARPAVSLVEVVPAAIGRSGKQLLETADAETTAAAGDSALIQVVGDGPDPLCRPVYAEIQIEDLSDEARFIGLNDKDLLVLVAASLLDRRCVAEGCHRAIPEALAGVFQHGSMGVLGVLP
ncbi:MAG: hypothetical protein U1E23_06615 [Reyranellaceae bacterium]